MAASARGGRDHRCLLDHRATGRQRPQASGNRGCAGGGRRPAPERHQALGRGRRLGRGDLHARAGRWVRQAVLRGPPRHRPRGGRLAGRKPRQGGLSWRRVSSVHVRRLHRSGGRGPRWSGRGRSRRSSDARRARRRTDQRGLPSVGHPRPDFRHRGQRGARARDRQTACWATTPTRSCGSGRCTSECWPPNR